jgi:hypothetical protein
MKRIFLWLGLASLAAAIAAASCSINHRSDRYECEQTSECDPGLVCSEKLCVPSGGLDAGGKDGGSPDANTCPAACTRCMPGNICVIDCAAAGANCGSQVVCPTGFNCDIRCSLQNSCRSGVICTNAASCTIQCTGRAACRGVQCGPGRCTVNCAAQDSCETVFCNQSCACSVQCPFVANNCLNVQCTNLACDTGKGCSTTQFPATCNTCP